jgi:hypothetical protein
MPGFCLAGYSFSRSFLWEKAGDEDLRAESVFLIKENKLPVTGGCSHMPSVAGDSE